MLEAIWKQISNNARIREKYAVIDNTYDPMLDLFVASYISKSKSSESVEEV